MKQKHIWVLIVGIIVLLGILKITAGGSDTEQHTAAPTFVTGRVESALVNLTTEANELGDIMIKGGLVNTEFKFKNMGNEPINLVSGETSCMCTEAIVKRDNGEISTRIEMPGHGSSGRIDMTIEPGEEATLIATFDPMAHGPNALGPIQREIILKTNSKKTPELRFSFNGNVIK